MVDGTAWVGQPVEKNLISYFQFLELFFPKKSLNSYSTHEGRLQQAHLEVLCSWYLWDQFAWQRQC